MKIEEMVLCGIGLYMIVRSQRRAKSTAKVQKAITDPIILGSNFTGDMWGRIHGDDLNITGRNPLPAPRVLTQTSTPDIGFNAAYAPIADLTGLTSSNELTIQGI